MEIKKHIAALFPLTLQKRIDLWCQGAMLVISVVTIAAVIVDYGFVLDEFETDIIHRLYNVSWWCFFINYTLRLLFSITRIKRKAIIMTGITGFMLLLSALPKFIPLVKVASWLHPMWLLLGHNYFLIATLMLLSILETSKSITTFINRNSNPGMIMAIGFAIIIMLGTLLLLLPRSTHEHIRLPIIDALFISTSAVCVTGLSPLDIAQTFSIEGQIVILLLIQIGGLGVLTFTSFFAIFFMGGGGLYNQFILRDMIGGERLESLISTLLYILTFTFVIEIAGAIAVWISIHGTMGMNIQEEIFFSIFHSVSAFCNAGFSTLTGNLGHERIIEGHNSFYLIISLLVVLGSIGFPLLVNFKHILSYHWGRIFNRISKYTIKQERFVHLSNINTKLVLHITLLLIVVGSVSIGLLEWNNAFAHMPITDKITHSIFNAVVPRTAGFNSVDLTHFSILTLTIYTLLMWIGGASQSTAGGIKVNTLAVAIANFISVIKGHDRVTLYNREISVVSIRRALATIFGSIFILAISFIIAIILEPNLSKQGLLFEIVSAYSTVGSSLNITPQLGYESKILIIALMYMGRIGLITFISAFTHHPRIPKYRYPKGDVIIN